MNINMGNAFNEQEYRCFIFSDDVNQIEHLVTYEKNSGIVCKVVDIKTELRFLRSVLLKDYNVEISRLDLLDNCKVFVLAKNFKNIKNIVTSELPEDKEVIESLKSDLFVMAIDTITRLSVELPNTQNKKNAKYRRNSKQLDMLKQISKSFGIIML